MCRRQAGREMYEWLKVQAWLAPLTGQTCECGLFESHHGRCSERVQEFAFRLGEPEDDSLYHSLNELLERFKQHFVLSADEGRTVCWVDENGDCELEMQAERLRQAVRFRDV